MGNHSVGQAFHVAFKVIEKQIDTMTKDELLEALDTVGNDFRGTDAEFDDYTNPEHPLGRALIKIFNPTLREPMNGDDEEWSELHYETVYEPFSERYEFC